jgi:CBS domain containing-hemolysin-like protein
MRLPKILSVVPLLVPCVAHASFLSGEALDTAAFVIAWVVICVVPIGLIVLFWLVHIMPEKIAEKRHHPQKDAINTLCLLSLVFGGLLWPIAWLWAYTKPVGYRMAYGTEKHDDYYVEMAAMARAGKLSQHELDHLRAELDVMARTGMMSPRLSALRAELATLEAVPPALPAVEGKAEPA